MNKTTVVIMILVIAGLALLAFRSRKQVATIPPDSMEQGESKMSPSQGRFVGTFGTVLPSASSRGRANTLVTKEDSTVTFSQDYQNQQPVIVETGTWKATDETLEVTLTDKDGAAMATPTMMEFAFDPLHENVLVLADAEAMWGAEGLMLQNMAPFTNSTWVWEKTQMSDGAITTPKTAGVFTVVFNEPWTMNTTTDCNGGAGGYTLSAVNTMSVGPLATTMMACEDSQEGIFNQQLGNVSSYMLQDGKLFLMLKFDSGTMEFSPAQ